MSRASTAGVWQAANVKLKTVTIDTDTTVHTLYGRQMGGRKSYNPKNKGKKSYQPRLTFLAETREYLAGEFTQRRSGRRSVSMRLLSSGRLGRAPTNKGSTQSDLIKETNMNFPIYDALLDAGASEEKAKIAAVSIPEGQYLASKEDLLKAFGEVKVEIANLRGEVRTEITHLRADMETGFANGKTEIANEFKALYRHLWTMGLGGITVIVAVIVALSKLFP